MALPSILQMGEVQTKHAPACNWGGGDGKRRSACAIGQSVTPDFERNEAAETVGCLMGCELHAGPSMWLERPSFLRRMRNIRSGRSFGPFLNADFHHAWRSFHRLESRPRKSAITQSFLVTPVPRARLILPRRGGAAEGGAAPC